MFFKDGFLELTGSQDYLNKVPNFQGSKVQDYYDKYKRSSITLDDNAFVSLLSATIRPIQKRVGFVDLGETCHCDNGCWYFGRWKVPVGYLGYHGD